MPKQKDRHLEAPGEANRDKHINFLAEEQGDADPASEQFDTDSNSIAGVDNGFFTEDDRKQKLVENENDKDFPSDKNEKNISSETGEQKKLDENRNNDDTQTHAVHEQNTNEDDQAH